VDCSEIAEGRGGKLDRFERIIRIEGQIDAGLAAKIVEIADKCPVHRTLESSPAIVTRVAAK
jgi:putative redox protein